MRVAILTENLAFGGINRYCLSLAQGLAGRDGVDVRLLALPSAGDDWLVREAHTARVNAEVLPSVSVKALRRIVDAAGIEVLHSQGYRSNTVSRLALLGRASTTRSVCTVHGAYHFPTAPLRSKAYYALDYLTMFRSGRVIPVSAATAGRVSRWVRADRLEVIHNGVAIPELPTDAERRAARHALGLPAEATVVCFIGRLDPQKGADRLSDLMEGVLRNSHAVFFLIVGDGVLRGQVEGFAGQHRSSVLMVGAQTDVGRYYAASDMIILPSRSEGLPMALIEAFAHGLPAVAFAVGGVPEVMVDGEGGFLCAGQQVAEMTERVIQMSADRQLRLQMGATARHIALTRFSVATMVDATYRVYASLLQEDEGA